MTTLPKCIKTSQKGIGHYLGRFLLKLLGWKVSGEFPQTSKFVAAVAPHTSNWDFIIAIAVKLQLGITIRFLGKNSIFFWPLGPILKAWGGMPVDRSSPHGLVSQVKKQFDNNEHLVLGLAPEGTRKKSKEWKTGFLHIAHNSNVPVVPMALDYRTKTFIIMPAQHINENTEQALISIKSLYDKNMAKYPENVSGF
ncbi:1-acyl-sn-glycerol-3-phosphate acyltransferase [Pseudoalteromonas sp. C2R02]|uniref:1-acyl-sn-glycerol-3-phosphate acyltransferase n=1 Tax=Pseudoalteromonas sp. C2R02 TaxID=2841565 RepID=UPI001C092D83|nr:1-acyl-sn-glycerol-3-phosphate acyltransferase [Pseudoalteromonas sp. C2R02]MBU2972217.1 1-acyl-sn-glycerol-3-phosphate acyltransferase [Pseudoalteromonas sp. C2R02]